MEKKEEQKIENDFAFYMRLQQILGESVTKSNLKDKINKYINQENIQGYKKQLFLLFSYLNPSTENFKSPENQNYVLGILNYILDKKNKNLTYDAKDLLIVIKVLYLSNPFYSILFNEISDLIINHDLYLEMLLLFIPEKDIGQLLLVMKKYININNNEEKRNLINGLEQILRKINFNSQVGFFFLKDILLKFLVSPNNILNSIKDLETNYISKNPLLRCIECYNIPIFSFNEDKTIKIHYECAHDFSNIENISNYSFKCFLCNQKLVEAYQNFICSFCKKLFCLNCTITHFKECFNLFFIPHYECGFLCINHKEIYQNYCSICNINMCQKCLIEHHHTAKKELIDYLNKETIEKVLEFIEKDKKNSKIILNAIKNILVIHSNFCNKEKSMNIAITPLQSKHLMTKIGKYNFQFLFFIEKLLGINIQRENKMFDEFYDNDFVNYYSNLINYLLKGDSYYIEVLNKIKNEYRKAGRKQNINFSELNLDLYCILKDEMQKMNLNQVKSALISKYYEKLNEIGMENEIFDLNENITQLLINLELNKIVIKSILNSEKKCINEFLKLVNRSVADSLIRYLIKKYSSNFKRINLNFIIYANIKDNYNKKDPQLVKDIERDNKEKIIDDLEALKGKLNNQETEDYSEIGDEDNEDNNDDYDENSNENFIIAEKPIIINGREISINELNLILDFLIYIKKKGDLIAHPKKEDKNNFSLSPVETNIKYLEKKNFNLNSEIEKINEYINSTKLLDFLFERKFKVLLSEKPNVEINELIANLNYEKVKEEELKSKFEMLNIKIEELKNINDEFKREIGTNIEINMKKELKEFNENLQKAFKERKNAITLLYKITKIKFENSIIGSNSTFIEQCLNVMINSIQQANAKKIREFNGIKDKRMACATSQQNLINFLNALNKELENYILNNQSSFDFQDFIEYVKKRKTDEEMNALNNFLDLELIKNNLNQLISGSIDWTERNNLKFATSLFLRQSKK